MDSNDEVQVLHDEGEQSSSSDDGDSDEFLMEIDTRPSQPKAAEEEEYRYKILSTNELVQDMVDCIKEVNTIVQMPVTVTRILLNHFNWDHHRLVERFYDGDQEKLFKEAHIVNPLSQVKNNSLKDLDQNTADASEDCDVCYANVSISEFTGLECGHRFCKDCWNNYLKLKIMDEGNVQTIPCAAHDCDIVMDDITVMKLVKEPQVSLRYQHLITISFVECNRLLRWCPAAGCSNAIKVEFIDMKPVTCKCNKTFCFTCGGEWHNPIQCNLLRRWMKKCADDSETSNWVGANTKDCPTCQASIEKNGGCNYIQCQKCKCQFCWICMEPWKSHPDSWYMCNKYVETKKELQAKTEKEKYEAALKRYLFYSNRYSNHLKSLELENQLYENIKEKMEEMQQHMAWIDVQFLKNAVSVLHKCRQTLMYTYAFAFYLKKSNQTDIFEDNQRDLEFATETLSGYLERDIAVENLADIRLMVQNKYQYCESRRKVLLEHVHEGYNKNSWEYLDI